MLQPTMVNASQTRMYVESQPFSWPLDSAVRPAISAMARNV